MKRKVTKKILAILIIITILATDFYVLGSNLITYAAQLNTETSNSNIEFLAYFKESTTRGDSVTTSIKNEDLKLYAEIKVKNEGYFNGAIEIQDSNFNIKNEILSSNTHIVSIEGNKVNLKQINAGETVEIELGIEPVVSNKIESDMLSKTSTVKLDGKYTYSKAEAGETVKAEKQVSVNYQPDESVKAELETAIITNQVFAVNETTKRIVQLLIKSRLTDNQYPVEQTILNVYVPQLSGNAPEEVNVLAIGKLATNGETEITEQNWTNNDGIIQIVLDNKADVNNEISWEKDAYDEFVVTLIYVEDVDASNVEITTDSIIRLPNLSNTYTGTNKVGIKNQEPNSIIMEESEITTEELYKGQLYANIDTTYETTTKLIVTNADVVDEIVMNEGSDVFGTNETELAASTKYVSTEINKEKMLQILGENGNIEIKNGDVTTFINAETEADSNGNIVINHTSGNAELEITTSNPVNAGVLELKHKKAITASAYTRAQLQTVKTIKTKDTLVGTITVNKEKQNIATDSTEASLELKETTSKAELIINRENLSTTQKNDVTLGIKLITDGVQYDLYKNPTIRVQLPAAVENVQLTEQPIKLYGEEFEIGYSTYESTTKTIIINLAGEQTAYPESSATQLYLQLKLNITLSELAVTQTDKITMTYTNENATQYDGGTTETGIVEQEIGISAPTGVLKVFNLKSNENTSLTEKIIQQVENEEAGKTFGFETMLVNNTGSDMTNVRILGKLPTTGNGTNTLETTLKTIIAPNAAIYYTENAGATIDTTNTANGWTTELAELTNAKLYLIKLDILNQGSSYATISSIQMPDSTIGNTTSYASYEVIYDTATQTDVTETSREIGLTTSIVAGLETQLTATVGQESLNSGDTVREGEVIKYTAIARNSGTETLQNLEFRLPVPEGTVLVSPIEKYTFDEGTEDEYVVENGAYVYVDGYYEEKADTEVVETFNIEPGQTHTVEYEVRVRTDITSGTEISNKATITYNGSSMDTSEIKNALAEANARVTVKRANDVQIQWIAGSEIDYIVYVENLSNENMLDLTMRVVSDNIRVTAVQKSGEDYQYDDNITEIAIEEIPANGKIVLNLKAVINEGAQSVDTYMTVTDSNQTVYRSNGLTEILPQADVKITLSSPQNNAYIKEGDIVEYNIVVENTGNIGGIVSIRDEISEYLKVRAIYVNGELSKQSIDETDENTYQESIENCILHTANLNVGEKIQLDIRAEVFYSSSENNLTITNKAEVEFLTVQMDSAEVTHILVDLTPVNEVSGVVWLDKNENGQIDSEESLLRDVILKLYDISTNSYLTDENGNIVQTVTNMYGEFRFSNVVTKGSYIIVVEYDTEEYEVIPNSIVKAQNLTVNGESVTVVGTDAITIQESLTDINIGLKEKEENPGEENPGEENPGEENPGEENPGEENPGEENPGEENPGEENPGEENPGEENPGEENPGEENPGEENPGEENPGKENPGKEQKDTKSISGYAWLDIDRDGQKDSGEKTLSGIKVRLYRISTKNYLVDNNGNIVEATTNDNGEYVFSNIEKDSYIVLFEYDTQEYEPTTYLAEGVETSRNSKVVMKNINIEGKELTFAVTDVIDVQDDVSNINIGLKEKLIFDLELNKYVSKIVVQTSKETKTYDYDNKTIAKVEIHRKQIQGALVVVEYTIKVKNNGEMTGYAKNIVDYLPSGLSFSSELNSDWYISGNNLYTKGLENVAINPGEEKEVKLILTKTMTSENVGLINNRAEIYQDYNKYGDIDIDSTPNNQVQDEDDMGSVDVIIGISTGGSTAIYIILLMTNIVLIGIAIKLMIKNQILKIPYKKERR